MQMPDLTSQLDLANLTSVLTDCIADGVYVLDASRKLTFMNAAAEQLLGYRTDELRGKDMHEAIHYLRPDGSRQSAADCPLLAVAATGEVVRSNDDVFVRSDGTLLPVAYTSAPVRIEGRIEGVISSSATSRARTRLTKNGSGCWPPSRARAARRRRPGSATVS